MLSKPDGCRECPLYTTGIGFAPDEIARNGANYALVGEALGKTEVAVGKPFQGDAGFVLRNWLFRGAATIQLAYERGKITIGNTLRCLPPEVQGRAYPRGQAKLDAERCCRQYDNWGAAHTIVLLGESAQRAWFGNELDAEDASDRRLGHTLKGVLGRVGREYVKDGRRWVFGPHPAFILRQPALVQHGQCALAIATNCDKVIDVNYVEWNSAIEEMSAVRN